MADTGSALSPTAANGDLLPDGVHPSLTGQTKIAHYALTALATTA